MKNSNLWMTDLKKSPSSNLRSLELGNSGDALIMNYYAAMKECDENSPNQPYRAIYLDKNFFDEQAALALKNVFFFLGQLFRYPDEMVYSEIRRHLETFDGFLSEYGEGLPPLLRVSDLQAEYVSLFVNNKGFAPALPYASFHMDQGQLMGRTYFKIKDVLEESGFCFVRLYGFLPDIFRGFKKFYSYVDNIYKQVLGLNDEKNEPQG